MLILTRRVGESIVIGDNVSIRILEINSRTQIRIGIDAPKEITVHREEIYNKIKNENKLNNNNE